jgi:hypothetical protein
MKCSRSTALVTLLTAGLTLFSGPQSQAFNWNKETVKAFLDNRGKLEAPRTATTSVIQKEGSKLMFWKSGDATLRTIHPGGHNLATRRGMDYAVLKARTDQRLAQDLTMLFGESLDNLYGQDGFAFQKILWGNFSNEIQTMCDAPEGAENILAKYMSSPVGYGPRTNVVGPDGRHSRYWTPETGYTSSNLIHSMLVSSNNKSLNEHSYRQEDTLKIIKGSSSTKGSYLERLVRAMINLVDAQRAENDKIYVVEESLKEEAKALLRFGGYIEKDFKGYNSYWFNSKYEFALRDLGSVFHTLQDSAVACTPMARAVTTVDAVPKCVEGDGHSVLKNFGSDSQPDWKIISLSDGDWYARDGGQHAGLDNLYQPANLVTVEDLVQNRNVNEKVYGSFDPAIAMGEIIVQIARDVRRINYELRDEPAYITMSPTFAKNYLWRGEKTAKRDFSGWSVARDNALHEGWKARRSAAVEQAAQEIAEKYLFSRYAQELQPLPDLPKNSKAGPTISHGSEE